MSHPVILTLSTNPIKVSTPPQEDLKHADLEHAHTPDLAEQPTRSIDHRFN